MEYLHLLRKLWHVMTQRWLVMVGLVGLTYLSVQSFLLLYGDALGSLLPIEEAQIHNKFNPKTMDSSSNSAMIRNPLTVEAFDVSDATMTVNTENGGNNSMINREILQGDKQNGEGRGDLEVSSNDHVVKTSASEKMAAINDSFESASFKIHRNSNIMDYSPEQIVDSNRKKIINVDSDFVISEEDHRGSEENRKRSGNILGSEGNLSDEDLHVDGNTDNSFSSEKIAAINDSSTSVGTENQKNSSTINTNNEATNKFRIEQIVSSNGNTSTGSNSEEFESLSSRNSESGDDEFQPPLPSMVRTITSAVNITSGKNTSFWYSLLDDDLTNTRDDFRNSTQAMKRMKYDRPPMKVTSMDEMIRVLARQRRSSPAMKPTWSSARDREISAAKSKIKNSPVVRNDPELDASLFHNVSSFKRSYELMESTLRVYVYKEGNKPIFHQPILKGLYSSEGWFMKLMEGNKNYAVKDPRRAHLFYIPFSSRVLQHALYVPNSHNRTNLRNYLKDYTENIAAKYPYFNRTGGADHFLVACHDWAPYVTRPHMERCVKALCNADLTIGFKLGRDVSLPETYVRSGKNPLRDLGGKPPSQRHILAFYAGKMHGYLRTILIDYWKDKDPDMKILGPMPPGVESKMNYIEYMKSSKYCICPKGYEVNSPRVVEAFFYECVPVIVSDNFVLPFFDVLDWSAFSVIVGEKDIPRLKDILASIPEEKYLEMQLGVRKVQRHFLWHAEPLKYDLFHMILHSIWYNRVFQI